MCFRISRMCFISLSSYEFVFVFGWLAGAFYPHLLGSASFTAFCMCEDFGKINSSPTRFSTLGFLFWLFSLAIPSFVLQVALLDEIALFANIPCDLLLEYILYQTRVAKNRAKVLGRPGCRRGCVFSVFKYIQHN